MDRSMWALWAGMLTAATCWCGEAGEEVGRVTVSEAPEVKRGRGHIYAEQTRVTTGKVTQIAH